MNMVHTAIQFAMADDLQDQVVAVRYMVEADISPGLLPRLLQPFAKRDLIPDRMWSDRVGATLHVEIAMLAIPAEAVSLVEGNLRQVIGVRKVTRLSRFG